MLFLVNDDPKISNDVEAVVKDYGNQLYMCAASVRELVAAWHKYSYMQRRWDTPNELISELQEVYGIQILYPQREHYKTFISLEWNTAQKHTDTTDMLIIAHAITEGMTLISSDEKFEFYCKQGLDYFYNK